MEHLQSIVLGLHVISGGLALGSGIVAILCRKGGKAHTLSGLIYYWAMLSVGLSAFLLAIPRGNMFLLMVGGFSTYMTLTGRRALVWRKEKHPTMRSRDYLFLALGVLTLLIPTAYFTWVGWHHIIGVAIVFAVFGAIMLSMILNDFIGRKHLGQRPKSWFLHLHIGRMMGAFIATSTAFLVTNWTSDPMFIAWLLPTALFSPVIFYFQWKFRGKPNKILKPAS